MKNDKDKEKDYTPIANLLISTGLNIDTSDEGNSNSQSETIILNQLFKHTSPKPSHPDHRHFDNCNDLKYLILEQMDGRTIPCPPARYWRIRLLLFALRDASGKLFIPLQYFRYGAVWTTPHIARNLGWNGDSCEVNIILKKYEKLIAETDDVFAKMEEHQYYQMGLSWCESKLSRYYTEYKLSPTLPKQFNQYKCYRIEEYHVTHIDPHLLINLYDPEHYHGYRYLPITAEGHIDTTSSHVCEVDGNTYFFDKPLSTNIRELFREPGRFIPGENIYDLPADIYLDEYGCTTSAEEPDLTQ